MTWPFWLTWDWFSGLSVWPWLNWFLDLNFFAALFGAYFGAWAAQRIAKRSKLRDDYLQEIRNCNAAMELAGGIINTYLALKRQHITGLKTRFDDQRARAVAAFEAKRSGRMPADAPVELGQLDLGKLDVVRIRTQQLEQIVMEKLSVSGRPRAALIALLRSIDELNESIQERNALIDAYRTVPIQERIPLFFGLPTHEGVDMSYANLIEALSFQTDSCIQFARYICLDLEPYGREVRATFKRKFKGDAPRVAQLDFRGAEALGLMPSMDDYSSWSASFVKMVRETKGRRLAKGWHWLRKVGRMGRRWWQDLR